MRGGLSKKTVDSPHCGVQSYLILPSRLPRCCRNVERDGFEKEHREVKGFDAMKEHRTLIRGAVLVLILAGCSRSTDSYIRQLESGSDASRLVAMNEIIARKGDPQTVRKVIRLLDSGKENLILTAIQLLGEMRDSTAVEPLVRMSGNTGYTVRLSAVTSLGKIGGASAVTAVVRALEDTSKAVRAAAVTALGEMHPLAELPLVFRFLRDDRNTSVRAAAVQALYRYGDVPGAGVKASDFAAAARDSFDLVRYVAVQALGKGWPDSAVAAELLMEALEDRTPSVRLEAIRSLEKVRCVTAFTRLKEIHDFVTPEEQKAIHQAIKTLTGEEYPRLK